MVVYKVTLDKKNHSITLKNVKRFIQFKKFTHNVTLKNIRHTILFKKFTHRIVLNHTGRKGADGYTPIKGIDYFDGIDGVSIRYGQTNTPPNSSTVPEGTIYVKYAI